MIDRHFAVTRMLATLRGIFPFCLVSEEGLLRLDATVQPREWTGRRMEAWRSLPPRPLLQNRNRKNGPGKCGLSVCVYGRELGPRLLLIGQVAWAHPSQLANSGFREQSQRDIYMFLKATQKKHVALKSHFMGYRRNSPSSMHILTR